jgi:hypothetical protein
VNFAFFYEENHEELHPEYPASGQAHHEDEELQTCQQRIVFGVADVH